MGREKTLTPAGRALLEATARGQVTYWPLAQVVTQRTPDGHVDVSQPFVPLTQARWAYIQPHDLELPPPQVPCLITSAGEDALMEAAQADKNRKKGARR